MLQFINQNFGWRAREKDQQHGQAKTSTTGNLARNLTP